MTCPTCRGLGYIKHGENDRHGDLCLDCADPIVLRAATSTAPPRPKAKDRTAGVKGARDNAIVGNSMPTRYLRGRKGMLDE